MYVPKSPWQTKAKEKYQKANKVEKFMLWFKRPTIFAEKISDTTTNYYVFKYLSYRAYLIDEYSMSSFEFPPIIIKEA